MMTTETTTPRVWVGCLGCYNAGRLVGEWFDATEAPENMPEFNQMVGSNLPAVIPSDHDDEQHEELWVFDHENFHGLLAGECSPVTAKELAEVLASVDNPEAYGAYASDVGHEYATPEGFEDAFCGEWESGPDYAQELASDAGYLTIDERDPYGRGKTRDLSNVWPFSCIDWEQAWRELTFDGYSAHDTGRGTVFIFRSV